MEQTIRLNSSFLGLANVYHTCDYKFLNSFVFFFSTQPLLPSFLSFLTVLLTHSKFWWSSSFNPGRWMLFGALRPQPIDHSIFEWLLTARFFPGSSFKLAAYVAAIKTTWRVNSTCRAHHWVVKPSHDSICCFVCCFFYDAWFCLE